MVSIERPTAVAGSRRQAWILAGLLGVVLSGVDAFYRAADVEPPGGLRIPLAALSVFVFWRLLEAECAPYRVTFPLDMGYFLYLTGFALLPYYMWRTQRWRGLGKLLALAWFWFVCYAAGLTVTWLLSPE